MTTTMPLPALGICLDEYEYPLTSSLTSCCDFSPSDLGACPREVVVIRSTASAQYFIDEL